MWVGLRHKLGHDRKVNARRHNGFFAAKSNIARDW
jgi:hypothetical protein